MQALISWANSLRHRRSSGSCPGQTLVWPYPGRVHLHQQRHITRICTQHITEASLRVCTSNYGFHMVLSPAANQLHGGASACSRSDTNRQVTAIHVPFTCPALPSSLDVHPAAKRPVTCVQASHEHCQIAGKHGHGIHCNSCTGCYTTPVCTGARTCTLMVLRQLESNVHPVCRYGLPTMQCLQLPNKMCRRCVHLPNVE